MTGSRLVVRGVALPAILGGACSTSPRTMGDADGGTSSTAGGSSGHGGLPADGAVFSGGVVRAGGSTTGAGGAGASDTVVPINDGRAARKRILQQSHCGTDTAPLDPSPCVKYQGCDPGYDATWCEGDGSRGIPNFDSNAVAAFFKPC